MATPDPALQTALDDLTTQVNPDNILAAHNAFQKHALELGNYLGFLITQTRLGRCGGDPISAVTLEPNSLQGKIDQLIKVHQDHRAELQIAADHLKAIALRYGHTEAEIERSFQQALLQE